MTSIFCFSGSGHSFAVAKALSGMTGCEIREITCENEKTVQEEIAVVVFPVYCQNIPSAVRSFLRRLIAKYIVLIAVYGKISYGNVLYEAQSLARGEIIAGAYIPIGHTFLRGDNSFCEDALLPVVKRISSPKRVCIPRTRKNPLASILPAFRSRIGVKVWKNHHCNNCGLCEKNCPAGAICKGMINSKCIRCLRCAANCPQNALQHKNIWILNKYLERYCKEEYVLYL